MIFTEKQCINPNYTINQTQPKLTEAEEFSKMLHSLAEFSTTVEEMLSAKMKCVVRPNAAEKCLGEDVQQAKEEFTPLFDEYRSMIEVIEYNLSKMQATITVAQLPTII